MPSTGHAALIDKCDFRFGRITKFFTTSRRPVCSKYGLDIIEVADMPRHVERLTARQSKVTKFFTTGRRRVCSKDGLDIIEVADMPRHVERLTARHSKVTSCS